MLIKIHALETRDTFYHRDGRYNTTRFIDVWQVQEIVETVRPKRDENGDIIKGKNSVEETETVVALMRHYGEGAPGGIEETGIFYVRGNASDWAARINEARAEARDCGAPVGDEKPEEPAPEE